MRWPIHNLTQNCIRWQTLIKSSINKAFKGKKPHTTISLTKQGRAAFREYKKSLQQVLDDLPD